MVVFICGTYTDLAAERQAVFDAMRGTEYEQQAMEFFGARPDRPIETCLNEVRASDVLIVIVGFLYGSLITGMGISYTEAEYEEGRRLGKPCYVYLRDEDALVPAKHTERDPAKLAELRRFRQTLEERHTVVKFREASELARQVAADLSRMAVKSRRSEFDQDPDFIRAEASTRRELDIAAQMQRHMLPEAAYRTDQVELEGSSVPCITVGGDYYDYTPRADGKVSILIADAAGKGVVAAMLMTSIQARLQILLDEDLLPAEVIHRLNRSMCAAKNWNQFATLFLAFLDPRTGELTYCNAGHVPPMLARNDGSVERLPGGGIVVGLIPDATYEQFTSSVEPAELLLLYTDGVTEAINSTGEEFGEDRFAAIAREQRDRPLGDILQAIVAASQNWSGTDPADDLTVVAARRL